MADTNATTFGASIVHVDQRASAQQTPRFSSDSFVMTPAASQEHLDRITSAQPMHNASVPVYSQQSSPPHPTSLLRIHESSPSKATTLINEKDLELGPDEPHTTLADNPFTSKVSLDCNKECKMWPSKQTLLQSRMADKKRKREHKSCGGCGPARDMWATFTTRQKLLAKIFLALLVVGAATAIGVGISIAVHGPVYVNPNHTQQIPNPSKR